MKLEYWLGLFTSADIKLYRSIMSFITLFACELDEIYLDICQSGLCLSNVQTFLSLSFRFIQSKENLSEFIFLSCKTSFYMSFIFFRCRFASTEERNKI